MQEIKFIKNEQLKQKPTDTSALGFGKFFTDYMAEITYDEDKGWHSPLIKPFAPMSISPANASFHYGQLIFEGLKAYNAHNGKILLFRPEDNFKRMSRSAKRLCMPGLDIAATMKLLSSLLLLEKDWVPNGDGCSLYIRPFMMANDNFLGVHPSQSYKLLIILSPVASYYKNGIAPVNIFVEDEYVRAVRGGTGESKCAGNYAASLAAQMKAKENGCEQVMWLDGVTKEYVEEIGTSNAFFVIDGTVITPELNGSILPGITRDSSIKLLENLGYTVQQRPIKITEIVDAYNTGKLSEAFASGTAAVVSPIGSLYYKDTIMQISKDTPGEVALKVYDGLTSLQNGRVVDSFGWVVPLA